MIEVKVSEACTNRAIWPALNVVPSANPFHGRGAYLKLLTRFNKSYIKVLRYVFIGHVYCSLPLDHDNQSL